MPEPPLILSEHTELPSQCWFWQVDQGISALSVTVPSIGCTYIVLNWHNIGEMYTGQWTWQVYYCILLWHSSALVVLHVPNVLHTAPVILHVPNELCSLPLLPDIVFTTVGFEPPGPLSRKPRKALGNVRVDHWSPSSPSDFSGSRSIASSSPYLCLFVLSYHII